MTDKDLVSLIRMAIKEELKPIDKRLTSIEKQVASIEKRQVSMEKTQKQMQKELTCVWDDIKKLDKRLGVQERKVLKTV